MTRASELTDAHCHFHGGLPTDWLGREVRSSGDPAELGPVLAATRQDVHRVERSRLGPAIGTAAFFRHYRAVEAHCAWMESSGQGTRDLYLRGTRAILDNARRNGVTSTRLFFSLTERRAQMAGRIRGLADAIDSREADEIAVRLTVPRSRALHVSYSAPEIQDLLEPLTDRGLLLGFDLSGLDSEVAPSDTHVMVEWLLTLREAYGLTGRHMSISVHSGEALAADSIAESLSLIRQLVRAGVDSIAHATVLWNPGAFGNHDADDAQATLEACLEAGVTFELCPAVSRVYGVDLLSSKLLSDWFGRGGRVVLGTDAPGLFGYDELHAMRTLRGDG